MCQYYCFNNSFKIFLISDTASSLSEIFSATFYKNPCTFLFHSSLTISVQSPTLSLKRVMLFFRLILESSWFTMLCFCCTAKLISYTYMLSESESHSSPGEGHGNSLQYSCWEIPWTAEPRRQATIHRASKSRTQLKGLNTHTQGSVPPSPLYLPGAFGAAGKPLLLNGWAESWNII